MKKVVIISDDSQLLDGLKTVLFSHEFSVYTFAGSEETLNEIKGLKPDLVMIDFLLNNANGGTLCHQLRLRPALAHLPVILLSDYPEVERFTAKFGCNAVIEKPASATVLINLLPGLLANQQLMSRELSEAS